MLESRSDDGIKVLKINDDMTLNLRKASVFSEEFLIHTTRDGEPIAYHMLGAEMEKNLYDDHEQMATVHVSEEDGLSVEGVLGHTLRIKPLEEMERSSSGEIPHELYEVPHPENEQHRRDDYSTPNVSMELPKVQSRWDWYKAPRLPVLITPEVHVIVDYVISKALNFITTKIARYVAIMTASANLRYRSIIQPRVQLVIVGVTVTKSVQEEPYMVRVKGYEATSNILNEETRYKLKDYVNKQPYFQKADIVFLLTGMNLSKWEGSTLQHWIGGSAFLGGVCTEWKVGLSEERVGSFYGVYVFAHELAHSLGCQHDGDDASNWPYGHIGSKDCDWNLGYIMSYKFIKPYVYRFSRCCQREIMNLYNRPEYRCLIVKNSLQTRIFSSKLPGDVSSRQTYCEKVYAEYSYVKVDREYNMQGCIVKCFISRQWDNMLIAAVDGVRCAKGKVCALGNCTSKAELKKAE
ncbi:venom metalloproteinase antarease-like TtrivMP_A [Dermacentor silvarum]|uniref:venom metalloproteinase antarease-like TtrivMP_A n=1 Tax=Dermacentor silvarum TaxID=543639 RepID=UPI0021012992|nr:venom metalloproteinase antarease-like TtrivMP_A [Dermacentor silvarum]XP_049522156.1 venom metalloproteinase antarease-like TtrivMP_A [Dermacentor silvarum]